MNVVIEHDDDDVNVHMMNWEESSRKLVVSKTVLGKRKVGNESDSGTQVN